MTPYFVADSAAVTVLRRLASSAFGSYSLEVPEGVDIDDIYHMSAPGNELGYVAMLSNKRVGGLARRFVRADVNVTAADKTDPDWVPSSDVDQVLHESATRVESDFFLESDITKAGLGPWEPFVDFDVGDIARVEIWGMVVELPVTRIAPTLSEHDTVDYTVHVGGQLISDDDARIAENAQIHAALVQDRRALAGLEAKTSQAINSASHAQLSADAAVGVAQDALAAATDADGVIRGYVVAAREASEKSLEASGESLEASGESLRF